MSVNVAEKFINRWFTQELISRNPEASSSEFLSDIEEQIVSIDNQIPAPRLPWQKKGSPLSFGLLLDGNKEATWQLWTSVHNRFDLSSLRFDIGSDVVVNQSDFLVTTPVARSADHALEAKERLDEFRKQGTIGYYYRLFNPWATPTNLRVGSKFFYVDQRFVTGFGVVTNLRIGDMNNYLYAEMDADTWRWIDAIPCDYSLVKPPQGYAYFQNHEYTRGISAVKVRGNWLDAKPKT